MLVLNVDKLGMNFGYGTLFKNVSFSLNDGEIISIVGPNGSGKTTLLKAIAGLERVDEGNFSLRKKAKVAYLDQKSASISDDRIVYDILKDAFHDILEAEKEIKFLEKQLEILDASSDEHAKCLEKYCNLIENFSLIGGYEVDANIQAVCDGLEINDDLLYHDYNSLSGGEKTLVQLAKCLLAKPDLLLLDEPTNNLDIKRIEQLEKFIKSYKGAILLVSHDRYFIDKVSSKILEIDGGKSTIYSTNYSGYIKQKESDYEKNMVLYKEQQKQIQHDKEMYRYFLSHNFQSRAKQFKDKYEQEIIESIPRPKKPRKIRMSFDSEGKSSKKIIETKGLTISLPNGKFILNGADMQIFANERVALLGSNGSGKSTFIKSVLGQQNLSATGEIIVGPSVKVGYLPQVISYPQENLSVLDTFRSICGIGEEKARAILSRFNFSREDVDKAVKNISGGEKVKLKLAELIQQDINTLILDEPTNHIDIPTRESLEDALDEFDGTIIFVSHDRFFIKKFANKIVEFKNGKTKTFDGDYEYYLSLSNSSNVPLIQKGMYFDKSLTR